MSGMWACMLYNFVSRGRGLGETTDAGTDITIRQTEGVS
jgi:hypothetical protein